MFASTFFGPAVPRSAGAARWLPIALVAALWWICGALTAAAQCPGHQNWPTKLVVPFPPGGPTDDIARLLARSLSKMTKSSFYVVNRAGSGGVIGAQEVAGASSDGRTILLTTSALAVEPVMHKLDFEPELALAPVSQVATTYFVLDVNAEFPAHTVGALIRLARASKNGLTFGSAGVGTPVHLTGELFAQEAKIHLVHVPYTGSAPALKDLMAGQIAMLFDAPVSSLALIKSGAIRALAITGKHRLAELPDTPTLVELGFAALDVGASYWMFAPKNTASCRIAELERSAQVALHEPKVKNGISRLGAQPAWASALDVAVAFRHQVQIWGDLVKRLHLQE